MYYMPWRRTTSAEKLQVVVVLRAYSADQERRREAEMKSIERHQSGENTNVLEEPIGV
jgi:hypothetical protein